MLPNPSIPRATVIPVLAWPDVDEAADWLCAAFGFTIRLRIGHHRVQLNVGEGAVMVREMRAGESAATLGSGYSVTVRVNDVDSHCERARLHGAAIPEGPVTHPYGERQYNAIDPAGHAWTFSQSVAESDPRSWGGTPVNM